MRDVCKNIDEYNPDPENKMLIVSEDMIADIINNRKLDSIVTELFIRGRKLNIYLVFITQSYFKDLEDVRLNTTHFLSRNIQIKENINKLHKIIHQMLKLKILLISKENVLLNHTLFG